MTLPVSSLAGGLKDIQSFLDDGVPPVPVEQWLARLQESLGEGPRAHDLWPAILLVGIRSANNELRDLCVRRYLELLTDTDSARPLLGLLSSILEEYDAYERPRAVLIQRIYRALQNRKLDRRSETVRFLLGLRKIFEISYDRGFVDGCVRCMLWLLQNRENPSDRVLSDAVHSRISHTLRFSGAPEVTELAIKRRLGELALEDVPADFVSGVYARLVEENNQNQTLGSLGLMRRWYAHIPLRARKDAKAFDEELHQWRRSRRFSDQGAEPLEDTALTRILEANSSAVDILTLVVDADHWGDSGRICKAAVDVLRRLPAARRLIADPDRGRWPPLLATFQRPDRRSLLPAALAFFERFTSGLRTDFKLGDEEIDPQELKTYRQRLRFVHNWADLENDRWIVQEISQLGFDIRRELSDRRLCLKTLDTIDPGDLPQQLADYASKGLSTDPLLPNILELVQKRGDWRFWEVCAPYLALVDPTSPGGFPHLPTLFRAAGSTGHNGMVTALLPWVFDCPNSEIQSLAEEQLTEAGYGIFVERERISRLIQSLQPQKNAAAEELYRIFERIGEQEIDKLKAQKQMGGHRFGFEQNYSEMSLQLTNYRSFTTGKTIDLAIIDKQLEELTQKIERLTDRKNELEIQRDRLLQRKQSLLNELAHVEQRTADTERRQREASRRLNQLIQKNNQLKGEHSRLASEVDRAQSRLGDTARKQKNTVQRLQSQYRSLQQEKRDNQRGIEQCSDRRRGQQGALRSASNTLSSLQARARSLESQRSQTPADSPRRSSLTRSIRDIRRQVSTQQSTIKGIETSINDLKRQIDRHGRRISNIVSTGQQIQQDIRAADETVKKAESKVSAACRKRDACQREIETVHTQIQNEQATIDTINERLGDLASQARRLRDDITVLQRREAEIHRQLLPVIRSLEEAKREFQKINRQREAEEQDLRQNNQHFQTVTRELSQTLNHHQQKLDLLYEEVGQVHRSLADLARQETRSEQHLNELVTRIRDRTKQIEAMREKAEALMIQQDDLAHGRSLLRRADQDRRELEELFDAYQLSKAAETYARLSRSVDE